MKRREAMLAARAISETLLHAVMNQGKGQAEYRLSHAEVEKLSATALDVAEYLCVPRSE